MNAAVSIQASVDSDYDQNDTISAFYSSVSGSYVSLGTTIAGGAVWMPRADYSGTCNDGNYAEFENPVAAQDNACVRQMSTVASDFSAQCSHSLSVGQFATKLRIAKYVQ